jgi:UDP-N-acetyl-D-galactosamine dehydrogenase
LEEINNLDGLIIAVAHDAYTKLGMDSLARMFRNPEKVIIRDIKGIIDQSQAEEHNACIWRL